MVARSDSTVTDTGGVSGESGTADDSEGPAAASDAVGDDMINKDFH